MDIVKNIIMLVFIQNAIINFYIGFDYNIIENQKFNILKFFTIQMVLTIIINILYFPIKVYLLDGLNIYYLRGIYLFSIIWLLAVVVFYIDNNNVESGKFFYLDNLTLKNQLIPSVLTWSSSLIILDMNSSSTFLGMLYNSVIFFIGWFVISYFFRLSVNAFKNEFIAKKFEGLPIIFYIAGILSLISVIVGEFL